MLVKGGIDLTTSTAHEIADTQSKLSWVACTPSHEHTTTAVKNAFVLVTQKGKTYTFSAESPSSRDEWLGAVDECIAKSQGKQTNRSNRGMDQKLFSDVPLLKLYEYVDYITQGTKLMKYNFKVRFH